MQLIKLPQRQYETLIRKASVYDRLLQVSPELFFEIENYSDVRVQEFLKEDRMPSEINCRVL